MLRLLGPIRVEGDGTPFRSYLHGADLPSWLWTLLAQGEKGRAYNVGSEKPVSIGELAATVARVLGTSHEVRIAISPTPGKAPERYVPSTKRARTELGLAETIDLEASIRRMALFAGSRPVA
jgi:nucleoside-diphosphate-sugar epimerase